MAIVEGGHGVEGNGSRERAHALHFGVDEPEEAVTALAVRFGVSRKTAYNRQRYDGHPAGDLSSWVASPLNAHPIASSALSS